MNKGMFGLLAVVLGLVLIASIASADQRDPRQEVVIQERETDVIKAEAPRPQVTIVLLRSRTPIRLEKQAPKLASRIEQATKQAPF
jgi:hypothetical protein